MEATISVICFKSKTLANGEHPLMLRITKDRKRSMKSLGLSILPKHWNFNKNEPKPNCPNRTLINQVITKVKLEWQKKLLEKQANEEEFTSDSLIKEKNEEKQVKAQTVEDFYKSVIDTLRASGNIGNYAYLNSYNSLKAFNNGKKLTYTFSHINLNFLKKYEEWMRGKGCKEITLSYQFRTLRATYNKAIEAKIVSRDKSPFSEYKIGKFNTKTQKRALSKDEVIMIIEADMTGATRIRKLTQDIFTFSYLCGGISFLG